MNLICNGVFFDLTPPSPKAFGEGKQRSPSAAEGDRGGGHRGGFETRPKDCHGFYLY